MEKLKEIKIELIFLQLEGDNVNGGYIIKIDKPTSDGGGCNTCYDNHFHLDQIIKMEIFLRIYIFHISLS